MLRINLLATVAFDRHCLEAFLGDVSLPLSFHIFETLPSTNQTLWELLDQGATPGTVVIALQQTAGRGQWGRQWQSSTGGLYLSIALAPDLVATNSAHLTLCSAWGITTALRSYGIPALIKWPNDLILCKRKLGGILTETRVQQGRITKAVVGVGINWANLVPETGINLESFLEQQPIEANALGTAIANALERLAAITLQGILSGYRHVSLEGIDALLPAYVELLSCRGRSVIVDGRSGVIVGVASTGELQVRLNSLGAAEEICLQPGTISLGYDQ
ncbi:biotin--[acetyl-CoA-carboxylase] ligase [Coleofasciculus sp. FACHB-1120]|uniref:biotin--[acetyl-CoA-carboxylase] ligase n=1 Tax=Coleofasciculus sp. FACHB-1120 TaxID=2692783 RepID=UPI0016829A36|nr:biotin--[acetyl-CoA-carboxylase] ligase [Coleofasciculus sp. FACHB-1120]MBD2742909.1 biotin--[acetyl-CoA-carboxylase] ligase [Coleofasciculus sp. FACHB-1120]